MPEALNQKMIIISKLTAANFNRSSSKNSSRHLFVEDEYRYQQQQGE